MSSASSSSRERDLPVLKEDILLQPCDDYWLYDVKFYPFQPSSSGQIFAVVGHQYILIYRQPSVKDQSVELIQRIEDGDNEARNCCMAWTKDKTTGSPILCVAGDSAKIKVIDARTGIIRATFIGHGGGINDLAISPINLEILASCSADDTIRLWSLNPDRKEEPCVALFAGEGHRATVLSIAFHPTGQYLLSGGEDHRVNLWTIPNLNNNTTSSKKPIVIYYPHFSTSQIHSNIVDCVTFYGDLVLSKALQEDCIVLWLIKGFNSKSALLPQSSAPTNYEIEPDTRSAFAPPPSASDRSRQYARLLQFAIPDCFEFYMRFSLYSPLSAPVAHPILSMCNSASKVFFWDFKRLEEFHDYVVSRKDIQGDASLAVQRPIWLLASRSKGKSQDHDNQSSTAPSQTLSTEALMRHSADPAPSQAQKYAMGDPFGTIEAHKIVTTKLKGSWTGRQVAWSPCGRWCVVVGSPNVVAIFERWPDTRGNGRREG